MSNSADAEQNTETTPLLGRPPPSIRSSTESARSRPPASLVVDYVRTHGLGTIDVQLEPIVSRLPSDTEKLAFELVVLLKLHEITFRATSTDKDSVWETWSTGKVAQTDRTRLEERLSSAFDSFVATARSNEELERLLWTSVPFQDNVVRLVRVVHLLRNPDAPPTLLQHPLVMDSLMNTWSKGWARQLTAPDSTFDRVSLLSTRVITPRFVHAIDLLFHLLYLALLAHYLLYPPSRSTLELLPSKLGVRGTILLVYSAAITFRFSSYILPCFLVLLAFLCSLPGAPSPGTTAYSSIHIAFIIHILLLHQPRSPSPFLLPPPQTSLPLASFVANEFGRTIGPALQFFTPGLLASLFLLFASLDDGYVPLRPLLILPPTPLSVFASPMETREAFAALAAIMILVTLAVTTYVILINPSLRTHGQRDNQPWDQFLTPAGLHARRTFVSALIIYSPRYVFIPPFNVLQLLFVRLPVAALYPYGKKVVRIARLVECILWWCTVGPILLVLFSIWTLPHLIVSKARTRLRTYYD